MDKNLPKYYKATSNWTILKQNKPLNEDIIPVMFFILHYDYSYSNSSNDSAGDKKI